MARGAAARHRRPWRACVGGGGPDQSTPGGGDPREDRSWAFLCRRASRQGPVSRRGALGADGRGDDVAVGSADERAGLRGKRGDGEEGVPVAAHEATTCG